MAATLRKVIELRVEGANEVIAQLRQVGETGDRALVSVGRSAARAAAEVSEAGRAFALFGRISGSQLQLVAFQLQDVITQLQLGAPALQVFAVQGAQALSAFGPIGATLAVAALAVGSLATSLLGFNSTAKQTRELLGSTIDIFGGLEQQVRRYAEALRRATAEERAFIDTLAREELFSAVQEARPIVVELASRVAAARVQETGPVRGGVRGFLQSAAFAAAREFEARLQAAVEAGDREEVLRITREAGLQETDPETVQRLLELTTAVRARRDLLERRFDALEEKDSGGRAAGGGRAGGGRRDLLAELGFEVEARRRLVEALRQGQEAYEQEKARIEAERLARQQGIAIGSEEYRQLLELVRLREELGRQLAEEEARRRQLSRATEEQTEAMRRLAEEQRRTEQLGRQVAATLVQGFRVAALRGEDLEDVLARLATRLADLALQRMVLDPLSDALGRGLSGLLGSLFSAGATGGAVAGMSAPAPKVGMTAVPHLQPGPLMAKGGVVDAGRVLPFAKGGIVDRPVLFPLRDGAGLMGEAGPEAVMPLTRLPDGRLGVAARADGASRSQPPVINIRVVDERGQPTDTVRASVRRSAGQDLDIDLIVLDSLRRLIGSGRADEVLGPSMGVRRRLV